jgi:hypothetical protein
MELIILESIVMFVINWSIFLWSTVVPHLHLQAPYLLMQDMLIPKYPIHKSRLSSGLPQR